MTERLILGVEKMLTWSSRAEGEEADVQYGEEVWPKMEAAGGGGGAHYSNRSGNGDRIDIERETIIFFAFLVFVDLFLLF